MRKGYAACSMATRAAAVITGCRKCGLGDQVHPLTTYGVGRLVIQPAQRRFQRFKALCSPLSGPFYQSGVQQCPTHWSAVWRATYGYRIAQDPEGCPRLPTERMDAERSG